MNNQQVREIAEAAFKARFGDIDIDIVNVKPGFDHYDDPRPAPAGAASCAPPSPPC